ncbi:NIPSNAP family protein [Aquirufa sp.]|jgi:hypothetical protein|uniref:NIPSNAP family protein n=1 Tax=Aquirufa sp. TaxID=2676249 RepID=UPI0037BE5798
MKNFTLFLLLSISFLSFGKKPDTRYFEMRIYYCHPGRLDALLQRFTNHTTKIFEKHGMTNVGYWIPNTNTENALYYILAYPSKAARDSSWKHFSADPAWKEVAKKSEESGKIVAKVVSKFMNATDFSPKIKPSGGAVDQTFELRTYTQLPGRNPAILSRFKNHTLKLFKKHGINSVAYFTTIEKDPNVQSQLVYLVSHPSESAAKTAWEAFVNDPKWKQVSEDSQKDGKIIEKLESIFMSPTSFSTIR